MGRKVVQVLLWPSSTPLSPEEKKIDTPRAPSLAYALQILLSPVMSTAARVRPSEMLTLRLQREEALQGNQNLS